MPAPSYVQPIVDDSFSRINAVVLLTGLPDTYLNWDALSVSEQADVATLYAANKNVFPLAHESKMDVVRVMRNGKSVSFREAFATKLLVRNSRPRSEVALPENAAAAASFDDQGRLIGPDGDVKLDTKKAQVLASGSVTARMTATQRVLGRPGVTGGAITPHQLLRAPAHFDAIQFVVRGANFSSVNTMKMSVCSPAQRGNGYAPLDGAGASMALTPVTWGSVDRHNFRNIGGGAATTILNNGSGTAAAADLIENDVASDWIPLISSDRVDIPGAPPLLMFRMYGTNPAGAGWNEMSDVNPNAWKNVDPDFYSGYWGSDQVSVSNPGSAPIQGWCPSVEIRYLLRGKRARTLAGAGDSVMQGWIPGNSVPQFGANINGYVRRLVGKLNTTEVPWAHVDLAYTGDKSRLFHERAMSAILGGHITDLIVKPWSVNEWGDGVGSVRPAMRRTEQLIEAGRRNGVNVIVEYLWGGNGLEASAPINALLAPWLEDLKASGIPVADIRSVMNNSGVQPQGLKDIYKTVNSVGSIVDNTHLNELGQEAAANALFAARAELGLG